VKVEGATFDFTDGNGATESFDYKSINFVTWLLQGGSPETTGEISRIKQGF